ncbi:MAG: hypothetical protein VB081_08065 [Christensenella sp.]|uniref:hypothetical protein n=1 Tax=Christensenella sp. TaxID=1935934 RepID=UPI002B206FA9|nr:hypothetical protein [Christensenella sp.]MEA5003440.1 hypothetical protein [Christensenella sp.]
MLPEETPLEQISQYFAIRKHLPLGIYVSNSVNFIIYTRDLQVFLSNKFVKKHIQAFDIAGKMVYNMNNKPMGGFTYERSIKK